MKSVQEVFEEIHNNNLWGNPESVSGPGSTLEATQQLRSQLEIIFLELAVRSIVDAPCGDFNWMKTLALKFDKYVGIDIVPKLIEKLRIENTGQNINFQYGNIITDILPLADVIFCRDCLVHLSISDIQSALKKWKQSGFKYLMSTTFPNCTENIDIKAGNWRPINLERGPFYLGRPIRLIAEWPGAVGPYADKSIGVWLL